MTNSYSATIPSHLHTIFKIKFKLTLSQAKQSLKSINLISICFLNCTVVKFLKNYFEHRAELKYMFWK